MAQMTDMVSVDLPKIGDAFGRMIARCWAAGVVPGASYEIVERSDGFIAATDAVKYFGERPSWLVEEAWACDAATGRVLDIGCGPGRHALDLQDRGLDVTGLEPSRGAADVARDRGITVIDGSLETMSEEDGVFDTLLLLGNNLGLLGTARQAPTVLDTLAVIAKPGARILATGADPYSTSSPEHLAYHERNRAEGRLGGQLVIRVRDRELSTDWFDYLLVSPDELADVVAPSPWRLDEVRKGDGSGYLAIMSLTA